MAPSEIKRARAELELSQVKMASLMGINTRKLERWEAGNSPISAEGITLIKLLLEQHRGTK